MALICKLKWQEEIRTIDHQHNLNLAQINAYNVLSGKPIVRTKPIFPNEPLEKIFIPYSKLCEMVEEAWGYQDRFSSILNGEITTKLLMFKQ